LAKIAPKTDTPNEPPMLRKKVAPDVAAPRSAKSAEFCTAMTRTWMIKPREKPSTRKSRDVTAVEVCSSSRDSRNSATQSTAVPTIG
jgi:hypothetical protein